MNTSENHSKNELIEKLESISTLYNKAASIREKMDEYVPEDDYEREIEVPEFPGEYESADEREEWEELIDHTDDDAIDQMTDEYNRAFAPKKPTQPKIEEFKYKTDSSTKNKQEKFGCFSSIAAGIAIFFLLGSVVGVDDSSTLPTIYAIVAIAAAAFILFKYKANQIKKSESENEAIALAAYNENVNSIKSDYNNELKLYEDEYAAYKLKLDAFLTEYSDWREIYLQSVEEECAIADKLEEDRLTAVSKIKEEELMPILEKLAEVNDLLSTEYLSAADDIIDLLKSNRADDLKEAINLYEDIQYRERQLQLQREQEEQRRYEEECRRQDEERRHREEMKFREEQEDRRRRDEEKHRAEEERRHREETKAREAEALHQQYLEKERLRKEQNKREAEEREKNDKLYKAAKHQCGACAHYSHCSMSVYNRTPNCTGFTPR